MNAKIDAIFDKIIRFLLSIPLMAVSLCVGFWAVMNVAFAGDSNIGDTPFSLFFARMVAIAEIGVFYLLLAWISGKRPWLARTGYFLIIAVVLCTAGNVFYAWWTYDEGSTSTLSVYPYYPSKEDNKLVVLDDPSIQTLEGDLPKISGSYALYPIYAAAVQAIYPPLNEYWRYVP